MMVKRCLLFLVLMSLAAGAAIAQINGPTSRAECWDFSVQTRYVGGQDINGRERSHTAIEPDMGWGLGFGYNLDDRFNLGFLVNWRSTNYTSTVVSALDPSDTRQYSNWMETGTFAITGDWNVLPTRITPYVGGALGWSIIDTNIPGDIYAGCWYDPWLGYICATDVYTYGADVFSYSVGVGMRLELSEAFFVRVGYDYNGVDLDGSDGLHVFRVDAGITAR
jgi:opacity protein-like surface antigen